MRLIKRIIKIHSIVAYNVTCLFNNGESRIIDFEQLFKTWKVSEKDIEYPLFQSIEAFQQVQLIEGTLVWKNIIRQSEDEYGNPVTYFYDLDPIVLYETSYLDKTRNIDIGLMLKQARKQLGLTQKELAAKSGTSKYYISRIENNKSGIELSTLIKIVEGGLDKKLQLKIV